MSQPIIPSRLKVGVDVPWVTSWSNERQGGIGPCPTVDGALAALQTWAPGAGKPLYSRNHLRRQRDSVRTLACPMCGEPTREGDRWSQTGRYVSAGELRARGFSHALPADLPDARILLDCGAIAPLHLACAEESLARCPHLGAMQERDLKPFPPAWIVVPLYIEARQAVGGKRVAAVGFLQLLGVTDDDDPDWRSRLSQG